MVKVSAFFYSTSIIHMTNIVSQRIHTTCILCIEFKIRVQRSIQHTASVRARLCKLQKCGLDSQPQLIEVYQFLVHGRWVSRGTPASSTTETGRHDIAEILLKMALSTINQIK
jgi:hypothetical protein